MAIVKTSEYKKITKELYKKNLDLFNVNKTFVLLQQLYEIIVAASSMEELTQQFIDVIVATLKFPSGMVAIEKHGKQLQIIALTESEVNKTALKLVGSFSRMKISLREKENPLVEAFLTGKKKVTHNILEIWKPLVIKEKLKEITAKTNIQSTLVYPIIFGKEALGSFSISLNRDAQDMTRFEKRTLRRVVTLFGIAIDRIKISQSLRKSNKRLKEVSVLKDEFVYLASHELRTPLTAIAGSLSTISDGYAGKINNKAKEFIEGAYNENQRLIRLVNNLLNISRIEGGRLKFEIKKFDLSPIVQTVVESLKTQAKEKKIDLVFNAGKDLIVDADDDKIREILVNLIGNAIKFTDQGRVSLTAWKQSKIIIVGIEDTGRGVLPEDQPKLFRKFERLDHAREDKKKGGTGLGLYICKNLIKGMAGEIWIESEHGKGSTFFFVLPISK